MSANWPPHSPQSRRVAELKAELDRRAAILADLASRLETMAPSPETLEQPPAPPLAEPVLWAVGAVTLLCVVAPDASPKPVVHLCRARLLPGRRSQVAHRRRDCDVRLSRDSRELHRDRRAQVPRERLPNRFVVFAVQDRQRRP